MLLEGPRAGLEDDRDGGCHEQHNHAPAITYRGHGSISNMPVMVPCRFSVRDNSLLATSGQGGALPQRRDSLVAGSQKINGEMHC